MPCVPFCSQDSSIKGFVCGAIVKRFHVHNSYVWMTFHPYTGPAFFKDYGLTKELNPAEDDPIWDHFQNWLQRRNK